MSLVKKFYTDRYLHTRYFAATIAVMAVLSIIVSSLRPPEFYTFHFSPWHLLLIPLGIYIGGLSVIFIHNATHGSFPGGDFPNWFMGHFSGVHQLWGFTNWKLMHLIHHQYSDDPNLDPHPPKNWSFKEYMKIMYSYSANKLNERYFEHWGKSRWSFATLAINFIGFISMIFLNLYFWYLLLGPAWFVFFYIPSYFANQLLFMHINYYGHPKDPETGLSKPGNLDHNWYYKLANALWFGIYYHGNHHRRPMLFNPKKMTSEPKAG